MSLSVCRYFGCVVLADVTFGVDVDDLGDESVALVFVDRLQVESLFEDASVR